MQTRGLGRRLANRIGGALPGVALCAGIGAIAAFAQEAEERVVGHPYLEALVLAILLGALVRLFWQPGPLWRDGINLSAKVLLEVAIVLLGASVSLGAVVASGPALFGSIVATVVLAWLVSYGASRLLRLSPRVSILIASGNSICGNSAIAAVAPVVGATADEIVSSIAFTAILGVVVVLALPLAFPLLSLSETQYGVLAGLTVYAVPQVLAATAPISAVAVQVGTLVKLVRVLMLSPLVLALSLRPRGASERASSAPRPSYWQLLPWFIVGFLVLAGLRSTGLAPPTIIKPFQIVSGALTIISMAALGLGVDMRLLGRVGPRTTAAVVVSLIALLLISLALIRVLAIA